MMMGMTIIIEETEEPSLRNPCKCQGVTTVTVVTMNCRGSLMDYCGKLTRVLEEGLEKDE
ncbi:MAG: hypothetical protein QOI57_2700 [Rubrobacteraceae bacterium]|nr:hypothetical protein [Rubrobacteraceae bacterium]